MTPPTFPPLAQAWAPHLDHEISQLVQLHHLMRRFWYRWLPEPIRRACRVAYASHFRSLMVFFHDRRPPRDLQTKAGCEDVSDMAWGALVDGGTPFPEWTDPEIRRLCDADKLLAHLSKHRVAREMSSREWGSDEDRELWRGYAAMFIGWFDAVHLPKTARAWRKYELHL